MDDSIIKINAHLLAALRASENGLEAAKRARATLRRCPIGHLQKDVYQARISNQFGEVVFYRWVCRKCGNFLDVPPWENLIGNPFSIYEKSELSKDSIVLDSVSSCGLN